MVKITQYGTGLQQYIGRPKRVTLSLAWPIAPPPPAREGAPLEAPPEALKIHVFGFISHRNRGWLKTLLARGGFGHLHKKKIKIKVKKNACKVWQ